MFLVKWNPINVQIRPESRTLEWNQLFSMM